MDFTKILQEHEEWCHSYDLKKIEQFDRIRKMMMHLKEKRDRLNILCIFLDGINILDESKRLIICELMIKCDEKYGITATYKNLSEEAQELVLKYIF